MAGRIFKCHERSSKYRRGTIRFCTLETYGILLSSLPNGTRMSLNGRASASQADSASTILVIRAKLRFSNIESEPFASLELFLQPPGPKQPLLPRWTHRGSGPKCHQAEVSAY